jgi:hypothetical protein
VQLRFAHSQNHSLPSSRSRRTRCRSTHSSLAGYVAATGEPLVIGDVYLLPDGASYSRTAASTTPSAIAPSRCSCCR